MTKRSLILVDQSILPPVYARVLTAKGFLSDDPSLSVQEAVTRAGISRSAFYKYKDYVFEFNSMQGILTLSFVLSDKAGTLSSILQVLASARANVLTINQNIPIHQTANVTITIQSDAMVLPVDRMLDELSALSGVRSVDVLANR